MPTVFTDPVRSDGQSTLLTVQIMFDRGRGVSIRSAGTRPAYTFSVAARLQELILGTGGYRVLDALRLRPLVYYMNQGLAFLMLERVRCLMHEHGLTCPVARELASSASCITARQLRWGSVFRPRPLLTAVGAPL